MRRSSIWLVSELIAICVFTFCYQEVVAQQQAAYGDIIGWHRGVPARSNGEHTKSGDLQWRWQCVDYVKRFYADRNTFNKPIQTSWGAAFNAFSMGYLDGFIAYAQDGTIPPLPNEILCFAATPKVPYGHVAIITEVDIKSGYVKIIDQNRDRNNPYATLKLTINNGHYHIGDFIDPPSTNFKVQGWLGLPFFYPPGTLLKSPDSPRVYVVNEEGKLRWIRDEVVFKAHRFFDHHIIKVPQTVIEAYPQGKDVINTYDPGSDEIFAFGDDFVFKITKLRNATIYLWDATMGKRRPFPNDQIYESWGWTNLVYLKFTDWQAWAPTGPPVNFRSGHVFQTENGKKYVAWLGKVRELESDLIYEAYGFRQQMTLTYPQSLIDNLTGFSGQDEPLTPENIWRTGGTFTGELTQDGELSVETNPQEAQVYLNGQRFPNSETLTPTGLHPYPAGDYSYEIIKQEYEKATGTVTVKPGEATYLRIDLIPGTSQPPPPQAETGQFRFTSEPRANVEVFSDKTNSKVFEGTTPTTYITLEKGSYRLYFTGADNQVTKSLIVVGGEYETIHVVLRPPGEKPIGDYLLSTKPQGAIYEVRNENSEGASLFPLNTTPSSEYLTFQAYNLYISYTLEGYIPWDTTFAVVNGDHKIIHTVLQPIPSLITIIKPDTGDVYSYRSLIPIKWWADESLEKFKLEYSADNGQTWIYITTVSKGRKNPGPNYEYTKWRLSLNNTSNTCLVKVSDESNPKIYSLSGLFTIRGKLSKELALDEEEKPTKFQLLQNYPNPANPATTISYELPSTCQISLKIYNSLGQVVKTLVNENQAPGTYQIIWDGKDNKGREISSGVYLYRLQAGEFLETKKMTLLR